jgi:LCP family protein required for cell wall assembly
VSNRTRNIAAIAGTVGIAALVTLVLLNQGEGAPLLPSASAVPSEQPATPSPTPEPTLNQALLDERLTVLLIGKDSNDPRRARNAPVNADTYLLASVSAGQEEVTLISIPRDTTNIPMPDGSTWQRKLNAIWAEQGSEGMVAAVESLLQVPVDAYVEIDMGEFVSIVDAVGGVTVRPDEPLSDPHLDNFRVDAGRQELDGIRAQHYVRTRVDTDYGRMARQQEVLLELARRYTDPETDIDVAQLLDGLASFETSLPMDDLPTLIEIVRRAQEAEVTRQVFEPPEFIVFEGDRGDGRGYILEPDIEAVRAFAARTIGDE